MLKMFNKPSISEDSEINKNRKRNIGKKIFPD